MSRCRRLKIEGGAFFHTRALADRGNNASDKSRAQIGSNRQDKFMTIEIEYCGQ